MLLIFDPYLTKNEEKPQRYIFIGHWSCNTGIKKKNRRLEALVSMSIIRSVLLNKMWHMLFFWSHEIGRHALC
jgi:hypothetical protein